MEQLTAIAENFIFGAPELAVWGWAILLTLSTRRASMPTDRTIRSAMIALLVLSFALPLLYALLFAILDPSASESHFAVGSKILRFLGSLLQAICWYVVLKVALRRRAHGDQRIEEGSHLSQGE